MERTEFRAAHHNQIWRKLTDSIQAIKENFHAFASAYCDFARARIPTNAAL